MKDPDSNQTGHSHRLKASRNADKPYKNMTTSLTSLHFERLADRPDCLLFLMFMSCFPIGIGFLSKSGTTENDRLLAVVHLFSASKGADQFA
jgi:hypothetical protein